VNKSALPFAEFIALIAVMFAMIAFGSDAMLPAFPRIAVDLNLDDVNRAQLVITIFLLGTGLGQLITGPMSDSLGRKPVILGGLMLFIIACVMAIFASSLTTLLIARFIQGLGVSAPRTVTIAMVRDQYSGRMMARVMSFAMTLFVLVPAVAPLIGQTLSAMFGWRSIFVAFILFALVGLGWMGQRQPETHPVEKRRPLRLSIYGAAIREVASSRIFVTYTLALSLIFGALFAYISSAQQVFVDIFDAGVNFPLYFAGIATLSGGAGILNATLVLRFGMRSMATVALGGMFVITLGFTTYLYLSGISPDTYFPIFLLWSVVAFFIPGLTIGNLNALAMEPMGHIAGMASAIIGAVSTMFGVLLAIPIGLAFNDSLLPLLGGALLFYGIAFGLMLTNPKGEQVTGDAS
jgi:DHA1 family bicyclomycin/chloramphenicol resistance-like MFS transporter